MIPKSTACILFLRTSGKTENMKRTRAKNAPRINNTTPRTKTLTTDGAIWRKNLRINCPFEEERLPHSKHCIVTSIEREKRTRIDAFTNLYKSKFVEPMVCESPDENEPITTLQISGARDGAKVELSDDMLPSN